MEHRSGSFQKNSSGALAYTSFLPSPLPPNPAIEISEDILNLLVDANSKLSVLEQQVLSTPAIYISYFLKKNCTSFEFKL